MVLLVYLIIAGAEVIAAEKKLKGAAAARWIAAGCIGTGTFVAVIAWYNYIRFGSILETGNRLATVTTLAGHGLFESAPLPTLAAMLFSPGKSIFLYNPVLILLPLGIYGFYRKNKILAIAMAAAIIANFTFNSFYTTWTGDYAWSLRLQVPVLPFLVLPLAELFASKLKAVTKKLIILLVVISAVIQVASVVYNFNLEFVQNPNHCIIPNGWVWDWSQSHLLKRFDNIGRHILNKRDFSSVEVIEEEPAIFKVNHSEQAVRNSYYVNFFPFKAAAMMRSKQVFYMLLSIWLIVLVFFCVSVLKLIKVYLAENFGSTTSEYL
jgi:hypothetical protein